VSWPGGERRRKALSYAALEIRISRRRKSAEVIDVLSDLLILRGVPSHIRSDNGPEFVAKAIHEWIGAVGAKTAYIMPGSPWENGFIESFNARLRDLHVATIWGIFILNTNNSRRKSRSVNFRERIMRVACEKYRSTAFILASLSLVPSVNAQTAAEFYQGKTLTLIVSSTVGGGYDTITRIVAKHLPAHLPGKTNIIIQNLPGAGGVVAANTMYNLTERTGLSIGIMQVTVPFEPLIGNVNAKFDPTKFGWVGSPNAESGVIMIWHTAPAQTLKDLQEIEINMGVESMTASPAVYSRALNMTLGTKMRIVPGYMGSSSVMLAMEKGEVHAFANFYNSMMSVKADWVRDKKVVTPVRWGPKVPNSGDDVYAEDIIKDTKMLAVQTAVSATLALGRPFMTPPGVSADRLTFLQKVFAETFSDPAFIADAEKIGFRDIKPQTGPDLEKLIADVYSQPKDVVDLLKYIYTGERN